MKFIPALALSALLAWAAPTLPASAQTAPMTPALAAVVAAANREGALALRSTSTIFGGADGAKLAEDGINQMFGTHLKVEWIPGPAYGPLAATLYQEKQGGQPASTDVYTSTAVQLTPYLDKGLFRSVDWVALMPSRIAPAFVEGGGQGLRYSDSQPGILYNPKAAPWVPEIAVAADLLKPQYKGKFYTTPFLGGFDVLLADDVWGEAKTEAYVRKLSPQLAGLVGCEATDRIATGEIPALAIDCGGGGPNRIQYRGRGVLANHVISDMAEDRYGYLSIPVNAAHPNAGILYALYILSPEGQQRMCWDLGGSDLYAFPDLRGRRDAEALTATGVKFIDVSIAWWRAHPGLDAENIELAKLVRQQ